MSASMYSKVCWLIFFASSHFAILICAGFLFVTLVPLNHSRTRIESALSGRWAHCCGLCAHIPAVLPERRECGGTVPGRGNHQHVSRQTITVSPLGGMGGGGGIQQTECFAPGNHTIPSSEFFSYLPIYLSWYIWKMLFKSCGWNKISLKKDFLFKSLKKIMVPEEIFSQLSLWMVKFCLQS